VDEKKIRLVRGIFVPNHFYKQKKSKAIPVTVEKDLKHLFSNITVWKKGAQRAPHKPLLTLYALGKNLRREGRLIPFCEIDRDLRKLLEEFGPTRKSYHTEYPFWRLRNDRLWELTNAENVETRKGNTDAKKSELLKHDVHGGFPEEIYQRLSQDRRLFSDIVSQLLSANFPDSIHEDILQAVGIDLADDQPAVSKRDPRFRDHVLRAYEYRCAVCGFNVRIGNSLVGLEAAHIKWHQAGGPDIETNGIALCALHHKLFDRGAFTVSQDMKVQVSENANGTTGFKEWLLDFHNKPLNPPQAKTYFPIPQYLHWHVREVFKGPARYGF